MRTISHKRPKDSPRGDVQAGCAYCGVQWHRSRLRRDRAGNLVCPDEGEGRDQVTLSEANARALSRSTKRVRYPQAENYDEVDNFNDEAVHITDGRGFGG